MNYRAPTFAVGARFFVSRRIIRVEILEGILERITYYSSETSYMVGRLSRQGGESVTFVGYFPSLHEGENLSIKGDWKVHPRYGKQFQVSEWESLIPTTIKGLEKFLSSGLIKGVGVHTARQLVKHFGLDTLDIMEEAPQRLLEVSGIGAKKAALIHQSYQQHKEIKEVMLFLQKYNISPSLAVRLFRHYGPRTLPLLRENPYLLAEEVYGMGFITADKIARKLGLPFNSPQRVQAAISYLLISAAGDGHVYLPAEEICKKVMNLLYNQGAAAGNDSFNQELSGQEVSPELVNSQMEELERRKRIVREMGLWVKRSSIQHHSFLRKRAALRGSFPSYVSSLSFFSQKRKGIFRKCSCRRSFPLPRSRWKP
jgi:exodeoxyribonuclease V alpha subunit